MKPLAVLIPKGLELKNLVANYNNKLDLDYLKYLVYYPLSQLAFHIESKRKKGKDWEQISIKDRYIPFGGEMQLARHDKFKKHITVLRVENIKCHRSRSKFFNQSLFYSQGFIKNKKAYSYRFSFKFNGVKLQIVYIQEPTLIKKIKKLLTQIHPEIKRGKYKFLYKYFDSTAVHPKTLDIDLENAIELCEQRWKQHHNYAKYLKEMNQIINIYNGIYLVYHNPDTDGRIHTNITNLPREYRKYLSYESKELIEVDISNSIPFFIGVLLSGNLEERLLQEDSSILLNFRKMLKTISSKEVEMVQGWLISGKFYDNFMPDFEKIYTPQQFQRYYEKEMDEPYQGTYKQRRKVVKKKILAMLFAETKHYKEEQKTFKSYFPELLEKINQFKEEFGYKKFSHILFQFEAHFMLNVCARTFNKKHYRTAPIFTLHDCLITTVDHEKVLRAIMKENLPKINDYASKLDSASF